jgi:hypothetical protein
VDDTSWLELFVLVELLFHVLETSIDLSFADCKIIIKSNQQALWLAEGGKVLLAIVDSSACIVAPVGALECVEQLLDLLELGHLKGVNVPNHVSFKCFQLENELLLQIPYLSFHRLFQCCQVVLVEELGYLALGVLA